MKESTQHQSDPKASRPVHTLFLLLQFGQLLGEAFSLGQLGLQTRVLDTDRLELTLGFGQFGAQIGDDLVLRDDAK